MRDDERDALRRAVEGLARAHAAMMESIIELREFPDTSGVAEALRRAAEAAAMLLERKAEAERALPETGTWRG
jgi:hypothetical protein